MRSRLLSLMGKISHAVIWHPYLIFLAMLYLVNRLMFSPPVMDGLTLVILWLSITLYIIMPKGVFISIYFNYLIGWMSFGSISYMFYKKIWDQWSGDIVTMNRLHSILIGILLITYFVMALPKKVIKKRDCQMQMIQRGSRFPFHLGVYLSLSLLGVLVFSYFKITAYGLGGIYFGNISDGNRSLIQMPSFVNRLTFAFPIMGGLLLVRYERTRNISHLFEIGAFLIFSFYVLTLSGSRFSFFLTSISLLFFLIISCDQAIIRKLRKYIIIFGVLLVVLQPVIAVVRSGGGAKEIKGKFNILPFLASWGGEYRDGSAALVSFGPNDREIARQNYLASLLVPVIPRQITDLIGYDRSKAYRGSAAFQMQKKYNIDVEAIRVGGIVESFFWLGYFGIFFWGIAIGIVIYRIDEYRANNRKTVVGGIMFAYVYSTLLYFIPSQSSALLPPLFAMFSLIVLYIFVTGLLRRSMGAR